MLTFRVRILRRPPGFLGLPAARRLGWQPLAHLPGPGLGRRPAGAGAHLRGGQPREGGRSPRLRHEAQATRRPIPHAAPRCTRRPPWNAPGSASSTRTARSRPRRETPLGGTAPPDADPPGADAGRRRRGRLDGLVGPLVRLQAPAVLHAVAGRRRPAGQARSTACPARRPARSGRWNGTRRCVADSSGPPGPLALRPARAAPPRSTPALHADRITRACPPSDRGDAGLRAGSGRL